MQRLHTYLDMLCVLLLVFALPYKNFACEFCGHYNVMDYGAISDGVTDDSQAFLDAWEAACNDSSNIPRVVVPPDYTFLVNPIMFNGPCVAPTIIFMISGTIVAPEYASFWDGIDASQWLGFKNVSGLIVDGFGTLDGQGELWWNQSCRFHPELENCTKLAPTAMKFLSCSNSSVSNLMFINSGQTHVLVKGCSKFTVNNLEIQSPGNSPNTDGIHIHASSHIVVTNSRIECGDDCISIGDYVSDIHIDGIECGPGHGISIGSLGKGGNYVQVESIHVANASFNRTTNGARIKTWQVGRGYVRNVIFENLIFYNVKNPIIIDQNYCDVKGKCKETETGVQISNIAYKEIVGTSSTEIAINLNCSKSVPCSGITMKLIKLVSNKKGHQVTAKCTEAHGQEIDVIPGPCLLQ